MKYYFISNDNNKHLAMMDEEGWFIYNNVNPIYKAWACGERWHGEMPTLKDVNTEYWILISEEEMEEKLFLANL